MQPENYKEGKAHEMMAGDVGEDIAEAGRGTDTLVAHLSLGEVVIPRALLDDPTVLGALKQIFAAAELDMNEFTVGHEANKINPETGYPEFFKLKKLFKKVAPIAALALPFVAPGIGTALGTALGATAGSGATTLGNALIGGGLGAASGGGLKGAALGAATAGIGSNLGDIVGTLPGTNNLPWLPAGMQPASATSGSGLLGTLGNATGLNASNTPSLGGLLGGAGTGGGGGSTFSGGNLISALGGGLGQETALKKQEDVLARANQQQQANLDQLGNIDVTQDPGYQFAVKQGRDALNTTLGSQGNLFSGRALQAASDLNQDLATRYYNDAYQRQAQRLGASNQLIGNLGEIKANTLGSRANNLSQTLSQALNPQDNLLNMLLANRLA